MDVEELTKSQIILLTLLISFVTSIATGIVTVSLLDQAPPAITQTINRVVERTIERVVPDTTQGAVVTKTIVVKEEDLITESIERNSRSLVRIYNTEEVFLGLGFFVDGRGVIATDASIIGLDEEYSVVTHDGNTYTAGLLEDSFLSISEAQEVSFESVTYADLTSLKLGQTVIALSGKERTGVSMGIVSGFLETQEVIEATEEKEEYTVSVLAEIETSVNLQKVIFGSPLVNMFGEVVGIHTTASNGYVPLPPTPVIEEEEVITE